LYLLSRHPEAARKVRDEIRAADVQDGKITLAALDQLPFTLQVFKETLRLYPPGYAFGRRTVQDVEIGPLKLERETEVVISPYALHRRMGLYEHPNEFIPERFERSREKCLSTYAYLPFGAGPRSCIGGGFSMLEGHVVLAVLFGTLTFAAASNEPVLPEPRMTLRPSGPVSVIIRREQGASDA
jgi:cytochrome P450